VRPPLVLGGQGRSGDDAVRDTLAWLSVVGALLAVLAALRVFG
jgi:hypothetical protein